MDYKQITETFETAHAAMVASYAGAIVVAYEQINLRGTVSPKVRAIIDAIEPLLANCERREIAEAICKLLPEFSTYDTAYPIDWALRCGRQTGMEVKGIIWVYTAGIFGYPYPTNKHGLKLLAAEKKYQESDIAV